MYGYTFFTWLITNLIHPVVAMIYFRGLLGFFDNELIRVYFFIFLYSLFISSVSLMIIFLLLSILVKIKISDWSKFLCWLIMAPLIIIVNLFVFSLLTGGDESWTFRDAEIGIPAMLSVTAVILIRYNYFIRACEAVRTEKADEEC